MSETKFTRILYGSQCITVSDTELLGTKEALEYLYSNGNISEKLFKGYMKLKFAHVGNGGSFISWFNSGFSRGRLIQFLGRNRQYKELENSGYVWDSKHKDWFLK